MNKFKKYIWLGLLLAFIIIQFIGPAKPAVSMDNPNDLLVTAEVPDEVSVMLKNTCYDCHSMETKFPTYSKVAPVSWFINGHIKGGREELNFSEWNTFDKQTRIKLLKKIEEEVEEGKMPMASYTWLHSEAQLSEDQKTRLMSWADEMARQVFAE